MMSIRRFYVFSALLICTFAFLNLAEAETIRLPNASFESPLTVYADPRIDSWQETPKPDWYDESGGNLWDFLTGVFLNTSPTNADHIDNCEGSQGMFLFAVPQVGIFQDYESTDWARPTPLHEFNSTFEAGKSYHLTIGIIGGGGGMSNGVSLEIGFYYKDGSNKVSVATTNIIYTPNVFSNTTHFVDCYLDTPTVKANDAWAEKYIGVQVLSTVAPSLAGGYWDLDNVRLSAVLEPLLLNPVFGNNQFKFAIQSEPGRTFEILASTNLMATNWAIVGVVTNSMGTVSFTNSSSAFAPTFYKARQVP